MVFSYHHSREDGWTSVAAAVLGAGFKLVQAQPVKAEMSVAMPKLAAKSPIDLDVLMVCRKAAADRRAPVAVETALAAAEERAGGKVRRFNATGRRLSLNDVRIVAYSQVLVELCAGRAPAEILAAFEASLDTLRHHCPEAPCRAGCEPPRGPGSGCYPRRPAVVVLRVCGPAQARSRTALEDGEPANLASVGSLVRRCGGLGLSVEVDRVACQRLGGQGSLQDTDLDKARVRDAPFLGDDQPTAADAGGVQGQGVREAVHLAVTDKSVSVGPEAPNPFVDMGGGRLVVGVDQVAMGDAQRMDRAGSGAAAGVEEENQKAVPTILASGGDSAVGVVIPPCRFPFAEGQRLDLVAFDWAGGRRRRSRSRGSCCAPAGTAAAPGTQRGRRASPEGSTPCRWRCAGSSRLWRRLPLGPRERSRRYGSCRLAGQ
jgi:hypothetical protein